MFSSDTHLPIRSSLFVVASHNQACKDHGFFYLENHNVPEKMIQTVFAHSKAFFDLNLEDKMRLKSETYNRGYGPMGEGIMDRVNLTRVNFQV